MKKAAPGIIKTSGRLPAHISHLVVELDHYKRRAEWLLAVNSLHARMAAALGLENMIRAYSVWLMPFLAHDFLAYHNPDRQRTQLCCSSHGPARRTACRITDQLLPKLVDGLKLPEQVDGFQVIAWPLNYHYEKGYLLLLRRLSASSGDTEVIEATLEILTESLQRALDYEDLYDQARRDALTGLANRRVLKERLGPLMESARRHGHPITIASMDLDNFKQINDTLGHARGDEVLKQVVAILQEITRQNDLLVRMGGDEFLLVLSDTMLDAARVLAKRLCRAMKELGVNTGTMLGISIGLSQWEPGISMEEWLQRADENLYKAKAAGKNLVISS
jgi:diguanylate cyclase (GGDEF)-like protein